MNGSQQLVQRVRQSLYDKIQHLHGTIRLLDVQSLAVEKLYVEVNVLSQPKNYTRLAVEYLLQKQNRQQELERFGLSKKQEKLTGLEAVKKFPKLMVLGKPEAGNR